MTRLVEIWNSIAGNTEVKKFADRRKAVTRIWKAIQSLAQRDGGAEPVARKTDSKRKAGKTAKRAKPAPRKKAEADRTNKKAAVIAMIQRAKGATLSEIMKATDWQAHTVRGFISILASKGGYEIESSKNAGGERGYRIAK
jgi:hypothetical protein